MVSLLSVIRPVPYGEMKTVSSLEHIRKEGFPEEGGGGVAYEKLTQIGAFEMQEYQQNRSPWMFVDEIIEVVPGKNAKGYKKFTDSEWFFPGHFPDDPNVPGLIQTEAMEQVFLMTFLTLPEYKGKKTGCIDVRSRYMKKLIPGNRLDIEAELTSFKRGIAKGAAKGYVGGELACAAEFVLTIPDIIEGFRVKAARQ